MSDNFLNLFDDQDAHAEAARIEEDSHGDLMVTLKSGTGQPFHIATFA